MPEQVGRTFAAWSLNKKQDATMLMFKFTPFDGYARTSREGLCGICPETKQDAIMFLLLASENYFNWKNAVIKMSHEYNIQMFVKMNQFHITFSFSCCRCSWFKLIVRLHHNTLKNIKNIIHIHVDFAGEARKKNIFKIKRVVSRNLAGCMVFCACSSSIFGPISADHVVCTLHSLILDMYAIWKHVAEVTKIWIWLLGHDYNQLI